MLTKLPITLMMKMTICEFNQLADEEEFEGFHNEEDEGVEFEHMTTKGKKFKKIQLL